MLYKIIIIVKLSFLRTARSLLSNCSIMSVYLFESDILQSNYNNNNTTAAAILKNTQQGSKRCNKGRCFLILHSPLELGLGLLLGLASHSSSRPSDAR